MMYTNCQFPVNEIVSSQCEERATRMLTITPRVLNHFGWDFERLGKELPACEYHGVLGPSRPLTEEDS